MTHPTRYGKIGKHLRPGPGLGKRALSMGTIDLSMMESSKVNPPVRVPPRRMQTEPNRLSEESQAELARLTKTN
jgi:hypothetical protein